MREQSPMRRLALMLPLVLLLAACGSSSGGTTSAESTSAAAPSATSSSTSQTPSSTTTTGTTTTTTSTTAAASDRLPCRAAGLALSFVSQQGGMGHGEIGFALRNTGSTPCRTYGWPGILFLDKQGRALPTIPHHTTNDFFGSTPAVPLVIEPGQSASFRLDVGHGVATSNGCATAYALQVIPPNDTATLRVSIPNGSYECRDANVSPLRAGTSAYP
jgi:guanyl-specific ribonuclease Sa